MKELNSGTDYWIYWRRRDEKIILIDENEPENSQKKLS